MEVSVSDRLQPHDKLYRNNIMYSAPGARHLYSKFDSAMRTNYCNKVPSEAYSLNFFRHAAA